VLGRGEKFELLVDRTDQLNKQSVRFGRSSTQLRKAMWRRNVKLWILLVLVGLVRRSPPSDCRRSVSHSNARTRAVCDLFSRVHGVRLRPEQLHGEEGMMPAASATRVAAAGAAFCA
jgi:hypothetical protein